MGCAATIAEEAAYNATNNNNNILPPRALSFDRWSIAACWTGVGASCPTHTASATVTFAPSTLAVLAAKNQKSMGPQHDLLSRYQMHNEAEMLWLRWVRDTRGNDGGAQPPPASALSSRVPLSELRCSAV